MDLCKDEAICLLPLEKVQNKDIEESSARLIEKSNREYSKEFRLDQVSLKILLIWHKFNLFLKRVFF